MHYKNYKIKEQYMINQRESQWQSLYQSVQRQIRSMDH